MIHLLQLFIEKELLASFFWSKSESRRPEGYFIRMPPEITIWKGTHFEKIHAIFTFRLVFRSATLSPTNRIGRGLL